MPKVLSLPPPLPKELIKPEGSIVEIRSARIATDVYTSMGRMERGVGVVCGIPGDKTDYSYIWSLVKEGDTIAGSLGRILAAIGVEETDSKDFPEQIKKLRGKTFQVRNRNGKLYWY